MALMVSKMYCDKGRHHTIMKAVGDARARRERGKAGGQDREGQDRG